MRGNGDETFEVPGLELFRRAIAHDDQDAWAAFQQCLEETVLTWLHEHPGREAACQGLCEKHLVAETFERFRQAVGQAQIAFETPARLLVYLRASLHGTILDTLRTLSRPGAVLRPVLGLAEGEPCVGNQQIDSNESWEALQILLPSAREQRLVYLLYNCGLRPREILHCYPQEWSDIHEIYRVRLTILERLVRHADSMR